MVAYLVQVFVERRLIYGGLAHIQDLQRLSMLPNTQHLTHQPVRRQSTKSPTGRSTHMRLPRLNDRDPLAIEHLLPEHDDGRMPALNPYLSHLPRNAQAANRARGRTIYRLSAAP